MSCGEIVITIFCGIVTALFLGSILVYCIGETIFVNRYNKFYETTEEGRKLYCARYMLDLLKLRKCGFIKNQMQLRDKIDEYITYMPNDNENGEILRGLKLQYKYNVEELKRINQRIKDSEKQIEKMIADLPKKYKGILEYNWRNAKVEVKEEDIC